MYDVKPAIHTVVKLLTSVVDDVLTPAKREQKIKTAGIVMDNIREKTRENAQKRKRKQS